MNWIQTGSIALICFLMARILIEADLHQQVMAKLLSKRETGFFKLVLVIMVVTYSLSLFFPNTIIVLAFIPVISRLVENLEGEKTRKKISTVLGLSLIYSANIGGMGSMTGTPLNLVYLGYIEINRVPGREEVTFFTWLLFGIPLSLILLALGFLVLRLTCRSLVTEFNPGELIEHRRDRTRNTNLNRYMFLFLTNIILMLILSGFQFLFSPPAILGGFNIIDLIFLTYLIMVLLVSFILPRGSFSFYWVKHNALYFFIHVLLLPFTVLLKIVDEISQRFSLVKKGFAGRFRSWIKNRFLIFWRSFYPDSDDLLFDKNPKSYVSVNRLAADLPYLGLIFMGLVIGVIFLLLSVGDNPQTPVWDGTILLYIKKLFVSMIPADGGLFPVILVLVGLSVFVTEFITNTTVLLVMIPIIITLASDMGISPLLLLLAVVIGSGAAFMTPIATSVNAAVYGGMKGISLKRMVGSGIVINILSVAWISLVFYGLIKMSG